MATPERFERPTHSLEGCCSIQLSYGVAWGALYRKNKPLSRKCSDFLDFDEWVPYNRPRRTHDKAIAFGKYEIILLFSGDNFKPQVISFMIEKEDANDPKNLLGNQPNKLKWCQKRKILKGNDWLKIW